MNHTISMVANAFSTVAKAVKSCAVINVIRGGKYRGDIDKIRESLADALAGGCRVADAKQIVSNLKKELPAILWLEYLRPAAGLVEYSFLFCADLDNLGGSQLGLRQRLIRDPHVYALFESPTGHRFEGGVPCFGRCQRTRQKLLHSPGLLP
jgi:hypothetical protein